MDKETIEKAAEQFEYNDGIYAFEQAVKWMQERSYSETEVKKLIIDFLFERGIGREVENVEKWLEQNKKK